LPVCPISSGKISSRTIKPVDHAEITN